MKHRCLTSTLLLTLVSASPAYTHRRPLEDQLAHHMFSERPTLQVRTKLQIKVRHAQNVAILDLTGTITKGESSEALRAAVEDLIKKGRNRILVNLATVTSIDSTGIGVMVSRTR